MDLSATFSVIESIPFMIELGVVSGFDSFLDTIEESPAVQILQEAASDSDGCKLLSERITQILSDNPREEVGHRWDIALAAYMHVLYWKNPELGRRAAEQISPLPNTYFAYGIAQSILAREAHAQAS